jgi:dipeptidase E
MIAPKCILFLTGICCVLATAVRAAGAPAPGFHTSPRASVIVSGGAMMNVDHFSDTVLPAMKEHFAGCRTIALVLHASHPDDRDRQEQRLQKAFAHLNGARAESLHRRDEAGQRTLLEQADGIFVGGGETFVLLAELYRTGQLELIRARVLAGTPYGGASAGANVAGLLIGTTNDFPTADVPGRAALGVFPATINPHHPVPEEREFMGRAGKIKLYLRFNPGESVLALANAALVRLHAGRVVVAAGTAWVYRATGVRTIKAGDAVPELLAGAKP